MFGYGALIKGGIVLSLMFGAYLTVAGVKDYLAYVDALEIDYNNERLSHESTRQSLALTEELRNMDKREFSKDLARAEESHSNITTLQEELNEMRYENLKNVSRLEDIAAKASPERHKQLTRLAEKATRRKLDKMEELSNIKPIYEEYEEKLNAAIQP